MYARDDQSDAPLLGTLRTADASCAAVGFADVACRTRVPMPLRAGNGLVVPAVLVTFTQMSAEHVALLVGAWEGSATPLLRVHSECLTGDVFGSARCDCGPQLQEALRLMQAHGGVLLYLRQEGRGIGLYNKVDAYELQDRGYDTFEANRALGFDADERDFSVAAAMLHALGIERCELLSNNPRKRQQLEACGIEIVRQRATGVFVTPANVTYLRSKVTAANHSLNLSASAAAAASASASASATPTPKAPSSEPVAAMDVT